jgi:hypothetical protein
MTDILGILLDGQPQIEFDRGKALPPEHLQRLDQMDAKMDQGIEIQGHLIAEPDLDARTRFVAVNLANALVSGQDNLAMAMCTWLGVRRPELKQVKISPGGLGMQVDLDYDHAYEKPEPEPQVVEFFPTRH